MTLRIWEGLKKPRLGLSLVIARMCVPKKVKRHASLAILAICSADLYVRMVDVIPTMLGWRLLISFLNSSYESLSAWQSITSSKFFRVGKSRKLRKSFLR